MFGQVKIKRDPNSYDPANPSGVKTDDLPALDISIVRLLVDPDDEESIGAELRHAMAVLAYVGLPVWLNAEGRTFSVARVIARHLAEIERLRDHVAVLQGCQESAAESGVGDEF